MKLICNGGGANQYLLSESGSIIIEGFGYSQAFCGTTEADWIARITNNIEKAKLVTITGSTLVISGGGAYNLTFTKQ
jgi:hypothetical protein